MVKYVEKKAKIPHHKIYHYDVVILGGGPAGLTAAIYASRYNMKTAVITLDIGGMANLAPKIENYPGFEGSGFELMQKFHQQALKYGAKFLHEEIIDVEKDEDGFVIERKTASGGAFSAIDTVSTDVKDYQDSGLIEETTYYYRVCAYNDYGNSGYSNEAEARTNISAPAAPTSLQALAVSGSQIYLSWTDNADNEAGFQIERKIEGVDTFAVIDSLGAGTGVINYEDMGLVENLTYYYQVCAYNITDNSDYSNIDSAATNAAIPDAPSDLQALAVSSSQIYLSWTDNANNETGFQIERRIEGVDTFTVIDSVEAGIGVIIYEDTSLVESTTYYYRISAFNSSGTSPYSNEANAATFATIPDPPSDLHTIMVSESQIILMWDDNSFNEEGFRIERKEGAGGAFSEIAILGMEVESYQDTTVDENTTYYL